MRPNAFIILLIILAGLIPVYLLTKYFQKKIRPRDSGQRLLFYFLAVFAVVFICTFLLVFAIKMLFPDA